MPMSNYLKDKLRKHVFGTAAYAKPSQLYFALYTSPPTAAGGGTEVSAPSYARVRRDPGDANWNFPAGTGEANNSAAITYASPAESWGTIVAQGMFDESGNFMGWENLTNSKTINAGDPAPQFSTGIYKAVFG